ncbi:FAD/NAD(P)-binding protein [Streptomyces bambusae]|uniref:Oxidoreductase n=1 Tax=Streptomyces bambusae TaxID=1550616 RepID=A0ABS6Z9C0_9ACTN|nr:FAD/NAD(P)-binding protein [Streptomyces bambusae]MBW5483275.1 oxidoreductase [Streptomyces bambusae]
MTLTPLPYRVVDRREETHDTVTLTLEPVGAPLPPFTPGRFAMLYAFGVGEVPVSVSGILDGRRLAHTVRAVGAVSRALYDLGPGAQVGVRGPFGTGWDTAAARARDVLVIAGGIGLAPLRPLIHAVLAEPEAYGRLNVLAGARTPADLVYPDEFSAWRRPFAAGTVDRPSGDWAGRVGVVTSLLGEARFTPADTTAFVCGPEVMIRATARALVHRGVHPARVQVSLERTMRCATGHCGHCQLGPLLLCRDGPVVGYDQAESLLAVREL